MCKPVTSADRTISCIKTSSINTACCVSSLEHQRFVLHIRNDCSGISTLTKLHTFANTTSIPTRSPLPSLTVTRPSPSSLTKYITTTAPILLSSPVTRPSPARSSKLIPTKSPILSTVTRSLNQPITTRSPILSSSTVTESLNQSITTRSSILSSLTVTGSSTQPNTTRSSFLPRPLDPVLVQIPKTTKISTVQPKIYPYPKSVQSYSSLNPPVSAELLKVNRSTNQETKTRTRQNVTKNLPLFCTKSNMVRFSKYK